MPQSSLNKDRLNKSLKIKSIVGVILLIGLCAIYFFQIFGYCFYLLGLNYAIAKIIAVCILVFPIIGIWAIIVEMRFAINSSKLIKLLEKDQGSLSIDILSLKPSGRADKEAAKNLSKTLEKGILEKTNPSWQELLNYALSLDAAGNRKKSRQIILQALKIYKHTNNN